MLIQFNTANNIQGSEELTSLYIIKIEAALDRFSERITRVKVLVSNTNSHDNKRCVLEARLSDSTPIAVTHQAENLDFAVNGATDKLKSALDRRLSMLHTH